ncbi:MAG: DNA polymerase ligase N-terminal domain-containing protein [Methanomicrobiales archaeon]
MTHYYLPMSSKPADKPFSSEEWLFEIKWDGIRAIAYVNDRLSVRSRNGKELAGSFPELSDLLELAPHTVLDGEIVAMSGGRPDIQEILPRITSQGLTHQPARFSPVTYIVFDILEQDAIPLVGLPLTERRRILLERVKEGPHVVISDPVDSRGIEYYEAAVRKGLEGVMAKRKDSVYEPGVRSNSWLKIKQQKTCDCVIAGYTRGQGGRSPQFGALMLALYKNGTGKRVDGNDHGNGSSKGAPDNNHNDLIYIGKVGSGFKDRDLTFLKDLFVQYETDTPHINRVVQTGGVVWLTPVLVCEVTYQSVTKDGKLRIPGFIRLRSDKSPGECTIDQLDTMGVQGADKLVPEKGTSGTKKHSIPVTRETVVSEEATLKKYRTIRNFPITPEPEGDNVTGEEGNYFVIHEHHARNLHFDLRLERDGVLKSWAVPKGVPLVPGEKHLAVAVEDHPLDYGHFEGTIPEGEYGAGTVSIWDNGTYETKHWNHEKIEITFHGKKLGGLYVLVRFKRAGNNDWLLFMAGT